MNRRVFVIEPCRHDLSPASKYGEIIYLLKGPEPRPAPWTIEHFDLLMQRLDSHKFDSTQDYILSAGALVPTVLFVASLVATLDEVHLLVFDAGSNQYIHVKVD